MDRQLRAIVAYWLACINAESALQQQFEITSELFDGPRDPFIFSSGNSDQAGYIPDKGSAYDIAESAARDQDLYFGYPLLVFFDAATRKTLVAPLLVIRLEADWKEDSQLVLRRAEHSPALGSGAFKRLGLAQEEIAFLADEVGKIFGRDRSSALKAFVRLLEKEPGITRVEKLDPDNLSSNKFLVRPEGSMVYNKAILFAGVGSAYNMHLLGDLEQLVKRRDLHATSLQYITSHAKTKYSRHMPVLPFAFDEYQLQAIQRILGSRYTMVTGPPGSGKSQFIANLIINLFMQENKVLFVSHTGEAVRVVNERINDSFANLIMQTGKKETRKQLGQRYRDMLQHYSSQQGSLQVEVTRSDVKHSWKDIQHETAYLRHTNRLHRKTQQALRRQTLDQNQNLSPIKQLRLAARRWQLAGLVLRLRNRRTYVEVLTSIERLKRQHQKTSHALVATNYLPLILKAGLSERELSAFVASVQNQKFGPGVTPGNRDKYVDGALGAMSVWSCTLKSLAATFPLRANLFDYVIFDEASQIDLPSAAPALYRAKNVVVVGDENQLTHITKIGGELEKELARKHRLYRLRCYPSLLRYSDVSLFSSFKRALNEPEQELKNHYRSHSAIANLFSSVFYDGRLKIHEPNSTLPEDLEPGVRWIDVKGTTKKYETGSKYNDREAGRVVELLRDLLPIANEYELTIGITTPYARQRAVIADAIAAAFDEQTLTNTRVLTVHQFQGSEVDILILSLVLATHGGGNSDYWFIKSKQLLNVAISRAKQLLLIVGDMGYALRSRSKLKDIAEYCRSDSRKKNEIRVDRPMNIFEQKLLYLLHESLPSSYTIKPHHIVGGRFTVDFALISARNKVAIELDGKQHEIIGDLPVFESKQREVYLEKAGWHIVTVTVYDLLKRPDRVVGTLQRALDGNN